MARKLQVRPVQAKQWKGLARALTENSVRPRQARNGFARVARLRHLAHSLACVPSSYSKKLVLTSPKRDVGMGQHREVLEAYVVKKRGGDEVKTIPAEEAEAWRDTDGAEWEKVRATGAIRALSSEESRQVLEELAATNKLNGVLPTRMVRRYKPGELPGEASTRKSRLCIRGDCDPDVFSLERHAPTASSLTLAMAMQVTSTKRWRASVGDLRNAFCQSEALHRKEGRLFARQPEGGLKGLEATQLLEIVAGAYGLNDAPAHWRRSLKS